MLTAEEMREAWESEGQSRGFGSDEAAAAVVRVPIRPELRASSSAGSVAGPRSTCDERSCRPVPPARAGAGAGSGDERCPIRLDHWAGRDRQGVHQPSLWWRLPGWETVVIVLVVAASPLNGRWPVRGPIWPARWTA